MKSYMTLQQLDVDAWLQQLRKEQEPPTEEQMAFLQRVINRCLEEKRDLEALAKAECQEYQRKMRSRLVTRMAIRTSSLLTLRMNVD